MNTKDRLKAFLAHVGMSQNKFEKKVGLSNGFVNNVGDTIRTENLQKITEQYPDLNASWLQTGQGQMLLSTGRPNAGDSMNPERAMLIALLDDYSEWKAAQTGQSYTEVKSGLQKKANLILGGLEQWLPLKE